MRVARWAGPCVAPCLGKCDPADICAAESAFRTCNVVDVPAVLTEPSFFLKRIVKINSKVE